MVKSTISPMAVYYGNETKAREKASKPAVSNSIKLKGLMTLFQVDVFTIMHIETKRDQKRS